ncbi:MAG: metallophosphoesterase [Deltaproteobacteria bacterium]|nr:metallophosphoesterase [Deltaproteobacteria bacterium]
MTSFSFIHTADLHLDSPFSTLGQENPDLASAMRSATFESFDRVIQLCLDKRVDFLLVAGDVYDGAQIS